jgi:hypothetical protein
MERNSSKGQNSRKTTYYAGAGLAIRAASVLYPQIQHVDFRKDIPNKKGRR